MKTVQEYINSSIDKITPKCTPEERKNYENVLTRILQDGATISDAMGITPDMLEHLYAYAYRLFNTGNYKTAATLFSFLVSINPDVQKYYLGSAACHHMLKEYNDAINDYMAAFYLDMLDPLPFYYISDCYLKQNKVDFAVLALGLVIQLAKRDPRYAKIKERAQLIREGLRREVTK